MSNEKNLKPMNPNQAWGNRSVAHPTAGDKNGLSWGTDVALMRPDSPEWLRRQALAATFVVAEVDESHAQDELLEILGIDPRISASPRLWESQIPA